MKERNYGIDALRMLAMFMVVVLHIMYKGGVLGATAMLSGSYWGAWFLEIACFCAVNCYALISGYVGVDSGYKYTNLVMIWLRTVFYMLVFTAIFFVLRPEVTGWKDWIKAFFPVIFGRYWYVTSYFALFLFIPLLNVALDRLTQKQLQAVIVGMVLVFSVLSTLLFRDAFGLDGGYTAWWLMIVYIVGGYIKKHGLFEHAKAGHLFLGYLGMIILTWLSKVVLEMVTFRFWGVPRAGLYLIGYGSPTILAAGVFLFLMFRKLNIPTIGRKLIGFGSPLAFSVYLIHTNPFVWDYVMDQRFVHYGGFSTPMLLFAVLITALAIYVVCSLLDLIREYLFKVLKLKERIGKLEEKYLGNIWSR